MTIHPTAHYSVYRAENTESTVHGIVAYDMLCLYAPQAVAADYVFRQVSERLSLESLKKSFRGLTEWLTGREKKAAALHAEVERTLGVDLPIGESQVVEMLNEVRKFKWLEAERAGRDIWAERNPRDPEAGALREWFRLHFGSWYLARRRRSANA